MTKIIFLGTGNAMATDRYNTCFIIQLKNMNKNMNILIDCGGGHEILRQFKENNVTIKQIDAIFITHSHADHIFGIPFLFRNMIEEQKKIKVICTKEVKGVVEQLINLDIPNYFEKNIQLLDFLLVNENQYYCGFNFFPVNRKQHGFILETEGKRIAFTGDTPCNKNTIQKIKDCDILIHEAFCSHKDNIQIRGNHSTIQNAINVFKKVEAKELFIVHYNKDLSRFNSDKIRIIKDKEVVGV